MDAPAHDAFEKTLDEEYLFAHRVLENYSFYENSTARQRMELLAAAKPVTASDGQSLIEAGYSCTDVVLVGRGTIRIYVAGESGREVTLYYVRRGESCPVNLSAALMGIGAFADADASGSVEAIAVPATEFRRLSQDNRGLQDYIFAATALRFGEVVALVREITTRRVDHRLAEYLLRKFDASDSEPPTARVTQQNIALELGTAREVVSRRLNELDSLGAVRLQRGKIVLRDRLALHRVISGKA